MKRLGMLGVVVAVGLLAVGALIGLDSPDSRPDPALSASVGADVVTEVVADGTESALRTAASASSKSNAAQNREHALVGAAYVAGWSIDGAERVSGAVETVASDVETPAPQDAPVSND